MTTETATTSQRHDFTRAIFTALVVGTILNLINQGDQLLVQQGVNFNKILLTYFVPFIVYIYSAQKTRKSM